MSIFEEITEDLRAADAAEFGDGEDSLFWKDLGFAFALHGDPKSPQGPIQFPLVLNPKSYKKRLPFALELTPTQNGGVIAEEQGVVIGEIQIAGNFGFFPKGGRGFSVPLSGQAHHLRIQNACFGRYSELKKDPATADSVFLTFHCLQDNEHFKVVPREGSMDREAGGATRLTYDYSYSLAIVDLASALPKLGLEDSPILKAIADSRQTLTTAVAKLLGSARDFAGVNPRVLEEIKAVQSAGAGALETAAVLNEAITGVTFIAAGVGEFLRGTKRFIAMPYATIQRVDAMLEQVAATVARAENLPADVVQIFRQMRDGLADIGAYPERFREDYDEAARRFIALTQGVPSEVAAVDAAAASTGQALATAQPGDRIRTEGGVYGSRTFPRYQGFFEVVVAGGDTLPLLAAKYLKDARRWIDIALVNELQAPYISDAGLPGTVATGDRISIPQLPGGTTLDSVRTPGNPTLGASQYDEVLGTDLLLDHDDNGNFTLVVDVANGATDFQLVAGVDNMKQALDVIYSTERGTNPLFTQMGVVPLEGQKGTFERLIEAQLNLVGAAQRDPRVARVDNLTLRLDGDTVRPDLQVSLIRNIQTRVIGRALS